MLLRRWFDEQLAAATYLVGCQATGEALLVDPLRVVDGYLRDVAREGLRVTHLTETHIHADFASGIRELAALTDAQVFLSGEGGDDWQYAFVDEVGATLLRDGDELRVGNIRVQVRHTPGHTPEHLTFIVTDTAGADRPMGALTGDFLFVGDVGRPDLLETAAGLTGTMEDGARDLYRSLRSTDDLPDYLQIWPGHGAGSACGKALGAVPQSTLGYERLFNWAFQVESEEAFVRAVLDGQPDPPRYFAVMKRINREGPPRLAAPDRPPKTSAEELERVISDGATVADLRGTRAFADAHVPGTVNFPMSRGFLGYAGPFLDYERDLYLIAGEEAVDEAVRALATVGFDRVAGWFPPSVLEDGRALARGGTLHPDEAARRLADGSIEILDVRQPEEWNAGHLPGAPRVGFGRAAESLRGRDPDAPLLLYCKTGSRSAVEASVLRAEGFHAAHNLAGGIEAWKAAGHPVESAAAPAPSTPA